VGNTEKKEADQPSSERTNEKEFHSLLRENRGESDKSISGAGVPTKRGREPKKGNSSKNKKIKGQKREGKTGEERGIPALAGSLNFHAFKGTNGTRVARAKNMRNNGGVSTREPTNIESGGRREKNQPSGKEEAAAHRNRKKSGRWRQMSIIGAEERNHSTFSGLTIFTENGEREGTRGVYDIPSSGYEFAARERKDKRGNGDVKTQKDQKELRRFRRTGDPPKRKYRKGKQEFRPGVGRPREEKSKDRGNEGGRFKKNPSSLNFPRPKREGVGGKTGGPGGGFLLKDST